MTGGSHDILHPQCCKVDTVKALLSPGGAYLLFAVIEGDLIERGAY